MEALQTFPYDRAALWGNLVEYNVAMMSQKSFVKAMLFSIFIASSLIRFLESTFALLFNKVVLFPQHLRLVHCYFLIHDLSSSILVVYYFPMLPLFSVNYRGVESQRAREDLAETRVRPEVWEMPRVAHLPNPDVAPPIER